MLTKKEEAAFKLKGLTLVRAIGSTCWRVADDVRAMKFSVDGSRLHLALGWGDAVFDVATGQRVPAKPWASMLQCSPNQEWHFEVRDVWRAGSNARRTLPEWVLGITNDGRALTRGGGRLSIRALPNGKVTAQLPTAMSDRSTGTISADGAFVLAEDAEQRVVLVEVATGRTLAVWKKATVIGFAEGSSRAFVGTPKSVEAIELPSGRVLRRVPCPVEGRHVSPDGAMLGFLDDDRISVLDVATGATRLTLDINSDMFAFSRDGARIAVADVYPDTPSEPVSAGVVFLIDAATGATLAPRDEGHRGPVMAVAAPARQAGLLVSVGDQSLRVWDRKGGHLVERLDERVGPDDVAVSADGKWAAVASRDRGGSMLVDLASLETWPLPVKAADRVVMDAAGTVLAVLEYKAMKVFSVPGRALLSEGNLPDEVFAGDGGLFAIAEKSLWKWTGEGFAPQAEDADFGRGRFAGISAHGVLHQPVPGDHMLVNDLQTGEQKNRFRVPHFVAVAVGPHHFAALHASRYAEDAPSGVTVCTLPDGKVVGTAQWARIDDAVSVTLAGTDVFVGTTLGRVLHFRLNG